MTTSTKRLTTAELRQIIDSHEKGHAMIVPINCDYLAAKELLAVRESQSKPAGFYTDISGRKGVVWHNGAPADDTAVYTAPPAPAVPAAIEPTYEAIKAILPTANPDEYACCVGADMWNACRAAMLNGTLTDEGTNEHVSQGYTFDGLNIRAVAALRSACSDQWLNSKVFADKVHWQNMHSIANEIMEAMAAAQGDH